MGWDQLTSVYVQIHLVIALGWFASHLSRRLVKQPPTQQLRFEYVVLLFACLIPLLTYFFQTKEFIHPSAQIWSETSAWPSSSHQSRESGAVITLAPMNQPLSVDLLASLLSVIFLSGILLSICRIVPSFQKIRHLLQVSHPIHRIGRVCIWLNDRHPVPFSFHSGFYAHVFLPTDMLAHPRRLRMALTHEIQHHRQRDTLWLYLLEAIRSFFFWNPLSHRWINEVLELQEFACDEVLVDQKKIPRQAYGRCLIEVAQTAAAPSRYLVGTASMARGSAVAQLKRRIQMLNKNHQPGQRLLVILTGLIIGGGLVASAFATKNTVMDRRISQAQAQQWWEQAQQNSHFPINLNPEVLKWLNHFVGTPDGRRWMRESIQRMRSLQETWKPIFRTYRAPQELIAVGLIESGFKNLPEHHNPYQSAGVWQFIPGTARKYNLTVTATVDERLDFPKATDAAMRYLGGLNYLFQDWRLAVVAYNGGETKLYRGIRETGVRDPWSLTQAGYGGDSGYLAKFMAAVLIVNNPESYR